MTLNETNSHDIHLSKQDFIQYNIQNQKKYEGHFDNRVFNSELGELKVEKYYKLRNGYVFIEVEQNGKPSGVEVTKAFTYILGWEEPETETLLPISFNVETQYLLNLISTGKYTLQPAPNFDSGYPTKGYLIPIIDLLDPIFSHIPNDILSYGMELYLEERKLRREEILGTEEYARKRLKELNREKRKK